MQRAQMGEALDSSPAAPAGGDLESRAVLTLRTLAIDSVEAARSGHPGTPMALAGLGYVLFTEGMKYTSADPKWPDRDRFVLSCGHASMLLYGLLHLTGHDLDLDEIRRFRQLGSKTPGHPEYGLVPGAETTTGPLGQGLGNAVGMALAERMLAARYNRPGLEIVDHRTWVIASDGDLMEGVSSEVASLAGHLRLGKLAVFWDDNRITIDGSTDLSFSEDVERRFQAQGWRVTHAPVHDGLAAYRRAVAWVRAGDDRPALVVCRTHIGHGSPNRQDTAAAHGAPLGPEETLRTKRNLGWPESPPFLVPEDVRRHLRAAGRRGDREREAWRERWEKFARAFPDLSEALARDLAGELPAGWEAALDRAAKTLPRKALATREASGHALAHLGPAIPSLVGGSADLAGSTKTTLPGAQDVRAGSYGGRTIHFGVREHGMGTILNGMALHGGFRPYGGTFLVFSDYMRPAVRLSALMDLPVVWIYTHDSLGVGEDGPTHQPVEHLASLRAMPGLEVVRPADGPETIEAWRLALRRRGPTALILTRQAVPYLERTALAPATGTAAGAYVLLEGGKEPRVALLATGSEVALALAVAERLTGEGIATRVVSIPCFERGLGLSAAERDRLLGGAALPVAIEAASAFGWAAWVGRGGEIVSLDGFGQSAPAEDLFAKFGFTPDAIVPRLMKRLSSLPRGG